MRRQRTWWLAVVVAALLIAGCAGSPDDGNLDPGNDTNPGASDPAPGGDSDVPPGGSDNATGDAPPAVDRAPVKQGTLVIEGNPEPAEFRLYVTAEGWPLQFSTYYPADMIAEPVSSGEGDAVRFIANFGGVRNDDAFVNVLVLPADTTEEQARQLTQQAAEQRNLVKSDEHDLFGSELATYFTDQSRDLSVWLALGEHDGRYYQISLQYPLEMGDGFWPRVQSIFEEWVWSATGEQLR